jgi:hypothetical protein
MGMGRELIERLKAQYRADKAIEKARGVRTVIIPARDQHEGHLILHLTLPWKCLHCGGPRGEPFAALSYDGSRRLEVHSWINPCGHVEKYSEIREAIRGTKP